MQIKIKRVEKDIKQLLQSIDVDTAGVKIMAPKADILCFHITQIRCGAANILKQDALSIGADFAMPNGTIECKNRIPQGVLIGSKRALKQLCKKLKAQPYGLKDLAEKIETFFNPKSYELKIMGIVNANDDSFYAQSRTNKENAIEKIKMMIDEGADIIDLGGVSSRPGSIYPGVKEELARVKPIIEAIYRNKLYEKAVFSIDSFAPQVVEFALEHGFQIINDITGLRNTDLAKLACKYGARVCIMHMQNDPQTMQNNPTYEDVILEIDHFFQTQIEKALEVGLKKEDIILDVGIGFGKSVEHNLELLQNLRHFEHFGCELLVGASRKSLIDKIFPSSVEQRLGGTLALHIKSYQNGASIIRVHDVHEHKQAFKLLKAVERF